MIETIERTMTSFIGPPTLGAPPAGAESRLAVGEGSFLGDPIPPIAIPTTNKAPTKIIGHHTVGLVRTSRLKDFRLFPNRIPLVFCGGNCEELPTAFGCKPEDWPLIGITGRSPILRQFAIGAFQFLIIHFYYGAAWARDLR
jgi:hypothetical protein